MVRQSGFVLLKRNEVKDWLIKNDVSRIVKSIQNHHTYRPDMACFNGSNHFARLSAMRDYHVNNNGWQDIAQNLTTFPDGKVAVCRSLNTIPAGIKGQNAFGVCVEHLGNFDLGGDEMTAPHREAIVHLNAVLCRKFGLVPGSDTIVYHHWFDLNTGKRTDGAGVTKSCPGTNFFGGNSVAAALKNLIPLVAAELRVISGSSKTTGSSGEKVIGHAAVNADRLNVRKGPGTDRPKVGELAFGTIVDIYERTEGWRRIGPDGMWVSARYLAEVKIAKVTAKVLNVRAGPDKGSALIEALNAGAQLIVYDTQNGWLKIDPNEKWVCADYVEFI